MCCEGLICASCAGPVVEGRCSTCRTARDHMHHAGGFTPQVWAALIAAAALLVFLVAHHV
jgi:hypothetical protein